MSTYLKVLPNKSLKTIAILSKYKIYIEFAKKVLEDLNLDIFEFTHHKDINSAIKEGRIFDAIFIPHYSEIIPTDFCESNLCIGFHTGELPGDSGGSPIQNKILLGEYQTHISAFILSDDIDGGDLLLREELNLESGNLDYIIKEISIKIASMIRVICVKFPEKMKQESRPTRFKRLKPEDSKLPLKLSGPTELYDRIRMVDGLDYQRANLIYGNIKISFFDAKLDFKNCNVVASCRIEILNGD